MPASNQTLRDLIRPAGQRRPDSAAIADGTWRCNYAELGDRVDRMAVLLHSLGVRRGDRVALLMPPSAMHVIALFGAIELGAIPCAMHVRETDTVLLALLERLSPRALVYDGAFAERIGPLRAKAPWVTAAICSVSGITPTGAETAHGDPVIPRDLDSQTPGYEPMPAGADDIALIALSSGTTGIPKGVMHTHRTLMASARCGSHYMAAHPRAVGVNVFTTAFIGWYNCTLPFLYGGSKVVYLSRWDPGEFLQAIEREGATVCFLVPTMWRMILKELEARPRNLGCLERVGYAGEAMDPRTMAQIRSRICPSVINTYGTTETGSWGGCTVMQPEDYDNGERLESVGRAGMEVTVRVIRPAGPVDDPLPPGEPGEVVIRGPSVASQLWEQPALARRIFDHGWWRSGDLGHLDPAGYLYLQGRVDDMIISGGINVFPGEVEAALLSHPGVRECAVVGLPSETWGQQVTAFVMAAAAGLTEQELTRHLDRIQLARYKRPREYRFVDELPRGHTGKVSRKLLKENSTQRS